MSEWDKPEATGGRREEIIAQFRTVALERIERLDAGWARLVADPDDAEAIAMIQREVHTLKGDSRMVGFTDVDLVCHKLEDLLALARDRAYRIDEDLDLIVTMALRFMTMLIRKRAGKSLAGIDLPGFIRQIDSILAESRRELPIRGRVGTQPIPKLDDRALGSGGTRDRLAATALDLLLETHGERSSRRVRRAWTTLRDLVMPPEAIALEPVLSKHEAGALELARDLGKEIELAFDVGDVRVAPAIATALDVASLHLVRNAIDHGVEPPDVRELEGKPSAAKIAVRVRHEAERIRLEISDDGHGIDFPRVRSRALALGLIDPATTPSTEQLASLLFQPGFSTRKVPTEVSGRGIGLDAVSTAVTAVGGRIEVVSKAGIGTIWTVTVPAPAGRFAIQRFAVRGTSLKVAVPADWTVTIARDAEPQSVIDLADELGLASAGPPGPIVLRLQKGGVIVHVGAASAPARVDARMLVATPAEAIAEVVVADGAECVLLRPALLVRTTGRVTILDDSEIVRELVRFALKPIGIEVTAIEDPATLLDTLAANPTDILLLDLSFRNVDFAEIVRSSKAAHPGLVVYLHSDRTPIELARLATETQADGHLSKTLGADRFVAQITKLLRGRRALS